MSTVPVLFGFLGGRDPFLSDEDIAKTIVVLKKHGITKLDTAQLYGTSEERIGQTHAGDQFTIDTKWGSREVLANPKTAWATKEAIVESAKASIARLAVPQVDIFYLHHPDAVTPLAETLAGVDEAYRLGLFRRFGLSNYKPAVVQEIYDIAKAKGYVLPTVYQGNYNAAARHFDTELIPLLRSLGIAFYAYSPVAGGLLAKTADDIRNGKGRFDPKSDFGPMYISLYNKPSILAGLDAWNQAAADEGIPPAELAYRWVATNSILDPAHGDAIVVGASSLQQLDETLTAIAKGSLSSKAVAAIDAFWASIADEAPRNNINL